ncbi:MAG TPA: glutathione S-transferase family protein [Stellaceae bacterium]|nr:glutathione S-transferase family protein [Stellaceae bacterium]
MANPIIYGTEFSTYVRTVRMAFEEKPAPYDLVDVSVINGAHKQPAHLARHPFGTVPAFAHDGFEVYETGAIIRYVDQVASGAKLTPDDPKRRARMNQVISIVDYHGYPSLIGQIVIQRLFTQIIGGQTDETVVKAGLPKAELCLKEWNRLLGSNKFLAGAEISLADLYLFPVMFYFLQTPEKKLMAPFKGLAAWYEMMNARASAKKTAPNFG